MFTCLYTVTKVTGLTLYFSNSVRNKNAKCTFEHLADFNKYH